MSSTSLPYKNKVDTLTKEPLIETAIIMPTFVLSTSHMDEPTDFDYYSKIVDIWIHQYDSFWTSCNVFLVVQGITLVAFFQAYSISELGPFFAAIIAVFGAIISLAWLLSGSRKNKSLSLINSQGWHLERKRFENKIRKDKEWSKEDVENNIPMFFTWEHSVFMNPKKLQKLSPHEKGIRSYIENAADPLNRFERITKRFSDVRELRITSVYLPIIFGIVWMLLLIVDAITPWLP